MENKHTIEPHVWQVGNLLTVSNKTEQRLIVSLTELVVEVIAETGWYNRYLINSNLPLNYVRRSALSYVYKGREQLFRDFKAGVFSSYFTINELQNGID